MSYISEVRKHITSLEHSKFVEIAGDSRFPAISTTRVEYPESTDMTPVSVVEVHPKHAVIAYVANALEISAGSVSAATSYNQAKSWDVVYASVANVYVTFPSATASTVTVINNSGTTITVKKTGGTAGIPLPDRTSADFNVLNNANEISFIRTDGSATPVSAYGIVTRF